ncbi:ArdC family protein [[Clostridium] symbiosum]|uniref:ArdC family protein n=1 Tax=Clostridium symbiosum TaxID=1512 RepID=UPI00189D0F2B|nr:ArdC family protein [[Clostridium] symbiosum]MDB2035244.1 ArdC family protein [[Clostridium] symbiosum]
MAEKKGHSDKIKELTDKLEAGIKEVFTSDKYREYLSTMQKFHNYSYNNSMLILLQKPEASYVAGYKTWETMERHVRKGEKGITIFAPCPYKVKKAVEVIEPNTGKVKRDIHGKPMMEEKEITYASFKAISIFDISQTEGRPLPELAQELKGEIPDYMILMDSIKEVAPVPIKFESWDKAKKGHYNLVDKEIVIKSGMSDLQTVKTAIHETAHSILHKDQAHVKDSATMEVEAESVAFVVCQHLGLDTSDYSFGYLAGWSSDKELPELKSSLQTIQKTAHEVIENLDRAILKNIINIDISQCIADEPMKISSIADIRHHRR